ncbi:MAG: ATP-binding protein [Bacteroidales bacterium]|nr:ATP-binding protein [Bacteroidales bacterium]
MINTLRFLPNAFVSSEDILFAPTEAAKLSGNYVSVIIGNNGIGKSTLLSSLAYYFKYHLYEKPTLRKPTVEVSFSKMPSRVIAVTNSIGDTFPSDYSQEKRYNELEYVYLGAKLSSNYYSKKHILDRAIRICIEDNDNSPRVASSMNDLFCFLGYSTRIELHYSVAKKYLSSKQSKQYKTAVEELKLRNPEQGPLIENTLNMIQSQTFSLWMDLSTEQRTIDFHGSGLSLEAFMLLRKWKVVSIKNAKVRKLNNNDLYFAFDSASSGEANILCSFISMISLIRDNSLIIIDEPEISLHPAWQARYFELLKIATNNYKDCHIIIATHSPHLLSDLSPERSTVITLTMENAHISFDVLSHSPYAQSIENILLNVFKAPNTRNYYFYSTVQEALQLLAEHKRNYDLLNEKITFIETVLPTLRDIDPIKHICESIINHKNDR